MKPHKGPMSANSRVKEAADIVYVTLVTVFVLPWVVLIWALNDGPWSGRWPKKPDADPSP